MMDISCTVNGKRRSFRCSPAETLQRLLKRSGYIAVRNSDDGEGFSGSDTILFDGVPRCASLLLAPQADGHEILTPDGLARARELTVVQQAMVDAGVVQSGYNAPAAALLLTDLLQRIPSPTHADIDDALSGLFNRATGYRQFYQAVELAVTRRGNRSAYAHETVPEFREELKHVGKVRAKVDGRKLVTGSRAFVEDAAAPDACAVYMLTSPHAHAYITAIDTHKALALEGVLAVITHENCPDVYYGQAGQGFPEPSPYDRRMFNRKVRHVGDRVAAVIAEDEEAGRQALALIDVAYEVLPPVLSIDEALNPGAPIIHKSQVVYVTGAPDRLDSYNVDADDRDGKVIYQFPIHGDPHRNIAAAVEGGIGNLEKGFAEAETVIERTYETSQIQCTPLETHTAYAYTDGDRLIIHASTQVPWHVRRITANVCGLSENKVQVIKERVGGGYGSKQDVLLEDVAAYAALITGRPVFYRFTREQEFIANSTRHPMRIRVKLGAKRDGSLTAIDMDVKANTGPYGNHCLTVPMNACSKSLPLVKCENVHFSVTTCYSNIPPTGAYQGYGAPKGNFAVQLALAELADELGMDQLDFLEKNRVDAGYTLEILRCLGEGREGTPAPVSSCGLGEALRQGAELIGWGRHEHSANPEVKIGKGVVLVQQGSGLPGLDHSCADISLLSDGTFMLHSGGADLGTGLDTVSVKFAAEVLNVPMDAVSILSGDTDNTPFDTGAYASSGTFFSGSASKMAAEDLRIQIIRAAAALLDEPEQNLSLRYPGEAVSQVSGSVVTYRDLARALLNGTGSGQLTGKASFTTEDSAFPYGAHFCQVAVNTRTGQVRVEKYAALQDCGTPVNPELALGQIYGGVLKSIGHSLYEQMVLNDRGECLNASLRDYGVPMISEMPDDFRAVLIETDDPFGPYGAKSVSEISTNGAAPVIASAIHDAVGVWVRDWPFTPEKILRGLGKID
jgi:putative selenate reductase molybdopterin-binding subunit